MSRVKGSDIMRLHPERVEKFFQGLQLSANLGAAAAFAGLARQTVEGWLRKGRKEASGPFRAFADRCDQVAATFEMTHLGNVHSASKKDAKFSTWLLERVIPGRYAQQQRHQISGADGQPVRIRVRWPDAPTAK